jgi:hypothetical protein
VQSCAAIAEALAAALNSEDLEVEYSITAEAKYYDEPPELGRELGAPQIAVYGIEEGQETPFDRGGGVKATRVANVLLECPINERFSLEMCLAWLNEVKQACREIVLLDRWYHDGNETPTPYDSDQVQQQRRFVTLFKATYFDFA